MLTLLVGTALALGALAYVLYPVFVSDDAGPTEPSPRREPRAPDEAATPPGDAAEALIERYRAQVVTCPTCGARPEPAAVFCSSCGRRLSG
jgi:ribosomal protein L40E